MSCKSRGFVLYSIPAVGIFPHEGWTLFCWKFNGNLNLNVPMRSVKYKEVGISLKIQ